MSEPDQRITEIVAECRRAVGDAFTLMVDVQYSWQDPETALRTLETWAPLDIFFVETPLTMDDLEGYRRLHRDSPVPIAAGEWQTTRFEFADLMDQGEVDVVQPDVGRVGGFTEAMRVCDMARERGRLVVPHCWKSGIGIAAAAHLAAVTAHCPYIEFLPAELCDSVLRRELVVDEIALRDGRIPLPARPGLGVTPDPDALARYRAV